MPRLVNTEHVRIFCLLNQKCVHSMLFSFATITACIQWKNCSEIIAFAIEKLVAYLVVAFERFSYISAKSLQHFL